MTENPLTLYTIPAGIAFADALAAGILEQTGGDPQKMAAYRILLPTRRACRAVRDTFLRLSDGKPLLLPQLQPIGDIDEEELMIELTGTEIAADALALKPALPPMRRQILLARAIMRLPDYTRGPDQAFALAAALGRLMDQIYTEGLDFAALPTLVAERELARHWELTVDFLKILSEIWPQILEEQGVIDAADRRARLIRLLAGYWREKPPQTPVIAAGSTGSIPATADLLKTVAGLPQGCVVLPGLDQDMDGPSWDALDDSHPQATLRQLLASMDVKRTDVQPWPYTPPERRTADEPPALSTRKNAARRWLAGEMMRPAATADRWQTLKLDEDRRAILEQSLSQIMRFDCDTPQDEAKLVAVLLRETLLTPGKTAALITPDRTLARRVATTCQRWKVLLDDSAGQALSDTPVGAFLRLLVKMILSGGRPGPVAALLKHKYCRMGRANHSFTREIDALEIALLRTPSAASGWKGLHKQAAQSGADTALLEELQSVIAPFDALMHADTPQPFTRFLDAHIAIAETLATGLEEDGAAFLWQGEDGEAAALFLAGLREEADILPNVTAAHYVEIIEQLIRTVNVRPGYGIHPRLYILGQLEARLVQADLVILAGLNEGTWPPDPGIDPWMSRPMRKDFKLPAPERGIGLSAHDFVQGFCCPHVVLTRARRVNGTPTVPARWLQRLETVLTALDIPAPFAAGAYHQFAAALDTPPGDPAPWPRPEPRPPADSRPNGLYVTAIEKWMRDPYSIYARYILKLRKLPALEEQTDAAQRGTMMHEILDRFIDTHQGPLPDDAQDRLLTLGREMLGDQLEEPRLWGFWWPRFERLAGWFVSHERQWRQIAAPLQTESEGAATLDIDGIPFTLSAKADRIDRLTETGTYAIIDYKTGTSPAVKDINLGYAPQLPLEAVILAEGGFAGIEGGDTGYMGFWKMTGALKPGEEKRIETDPEAARAGLGRLIRTFRDPQTPYYSLPRPDKAPPATWQDYAHLARIQEWAALDDSAEDAA
ncbi:MAG: double-strand break repair protein AddB [Rhodospirillales bacterium]|nr:double-strand break repair protein AddB [Rhodospirillales bacterium]MCB9997108.1 double-strand break repair protein AddB [Rhodospirillales bacterium]